MHWNGIMYAGSNALPLQRRDQLIARLVRHDILMIDMLTVPERFW